MNADRNPIYTGGLRGSDDTALERSGILGVHRRWTNINRYEVIFLISALLAALVTDGLTVYRLFKIERIDADFAYGIILLSTSVFLLIFLSTGIFQQRVTDIIVFFVCALMMTIYVIVHFIYRLNYPPSNETETDKALREIRLVFTCVFNVLFVPLSIIVIRDYKREEFAKRLLGAFQAQHGLLRMYNILDCIARVNTMFSISVFLLNLYNFNDYATSDTILLIVGIPLALIWLGVTIGMIRLENYALFVIFVVLSLFQPGFLIYCLYSDTTSPSTPTTPIFSNSTMTPFFSNTTDTPFDFNSTDTTMFSSSTAATPSIYVPIALYVCIGFNILTHVASAVCAGLCIQNFNKGLKEKVFNNKIDRWYQRRFTRT